jgi:beta-lactam-binding protein with PASTA domain
MKGLLRFIFSRSFIKNGALSLVVFGILVGLAFFALKSYTNHGHSVDVPDLTGLTMDETVEVIKEAGLRYKLEDPVYMPDKKLGTIVSQNPPSTYIDPEDGDEKTRKVKANRQIYLTFNRDSPPLVEMPDLVEKHSQRSAEMILKMIGIEVEKVITERSKFENLVMKQLYKGKELEPGTKLPKGEKITLVVGKRNTAQVSVPKIVGYTYKEAKNILSKVSLNIGDITGGCSGCATGQDTLNAYILKQSPELGGYLAKGQDVRVKLTQDKSEVPQ